jgi:hypothetical protein
MAAGPMLPALARVAGLYGRAVVSVAARRVAVRLGLYLVVILLTVVGVAFLYVSIFRAIEQALGPVYAPLILGCLHLAGAVVALLVAQMRRRW